MFKIRIFVTILLFILSDWKKKWLRNAEEGNLKDMKEIYQQLKDKGLQQEVGNFKDSSGINAFMWATIYGHLDICQFLLREDLVDVNSKDVDGSNALHDAASNNQPEIAKWLLEETSIDVNAQTKDGWTGLHYAAWYKYLEVIKILLKCKPRLLKNKWNETALDVARRTIFKEEEIIQNIKTHYNM